MLCMIACFICRRYWVLAGEEVEETEEVEEEPIDNVSRL